MSKVRQDYKDEVIEAISYPLRDGGYTLHFYLERPGHSSSSRISNRANVSRLTRRPCEAGLNSASSRLT